MNSSVDLAIASKRSVLCPILPWRTLQRHKIKPSQIKSRKTFASIYCKVHQHQKPRAAAWVSRAYAINKVCEFACAFFYLVCVFADRASMVDKMECYNVGGCPRLSRIEASGASHSADIHREVCLFGLQLSGHPAVSKEKSCACAKVYRTRTWVHHPAPPLPFHQNLHFIIFDIFAHCATRTGNLVMRGLFIHCTWWDLHARHVLLIVDVSHAFEFGLNNAVRRCPVHFTCHVIRPSMS